MKNILTIFFVLFAAGFTIAQLSSTGKPTQQNISYTIIQTQDNTFGYDILVNNKLSIHQPNRPGMPGKQGFKKKTDAIKVAKYVISKMEKGIMPPTVSQEEMKTLKVL